MEAVMASCNSYRLIVVSTVSEPSSLRELLALQVLRKNTSVTSVANKTDNFLVVFFMASSDVY